MGQSVAFPAIGMGFDLSGLEQGLQQMQTMTSKAMEQIKASMGGGKSGFDMIDSLSRYNNPTWGKLKDQATALVASQTAAAEAEKAAKEAGNAWKEKLREVGKSALEFVGASMEQVVNLAKAPGKTVMGALGMATPINQALELAAKIKELVAKPMEAALSRDKGREDVASGGLSLMNSGTISGTLARFEAQVDKMFESIWDAINKVFDIPGLIEFFRGGMGAIGLIIESAFGPITESINNPEVLREQFKAGGEMALDIFESITKAGVEIANSWIDVVNYIKTIPGLSTVVGDFTEDQEKLIAQFQNKNMAKLTPAEQLQARQDKVKEMFLAGPLMPDMANPWKAVDGLDNGVISRDEAIKQLRKSGDLPQPLAKFNMDSITDMFEKGREKWKDSIGQEFVPDLPEGTKLDATKALQAFTDALWKTSDPLFALQKAAEDDQKKIDDLVNQMGNREVDGLAILDAMGAAEEAANERTMAWLNGIEKENAASALSNVGENGSVMVAEAVAKAIAGTQADDIQTRIYEAIQEQTKVQEQVRDANRGMAQAFARFKPGQPLIPGGF